MKSVEGASVSETENRLEHFGAHHPPRTAIEHSWPFHYRSAVPVESGQIRPTGGTLIDRRRGPLQIG